MRISNFQFPISKKGFTLIEAVVATALFAVVISSILGVYISTIRLDRKTRSQRAVAQNARYIMDFLAKEVRNGKIDYSSSNSCTNALNTLCLINQTVDNEQFFWNGTDSLVFVKNNNATLLNSSGVKVSNLKFYLRPSGDPFTAAKTYNQQPSVTILLRLTSNYGTKVIETVELNLQDTFTSHYYPSRQ